MDLTSGPIVEWFLIVFMGFLFSLGSYLVWLDVSDWMRSRPSRRGGRT